MYELLKGCTQRHLYTLQFSGLFLCVLVLTTASMLCLRGLHLCEFSVLKFAAEPMFCMTYVY